MNRRKMMKIKQIEIQNQGDEAKIIINTDKLDENTSNEDIVLLADELALYIKSHFLKKKPQSKNCGCK